MVNVKVGAVRIERMSIGTRLFHIVHPFSIFDDFLFLCFFIL